MPDVYHRLPVPADGERGGYGHKHPVHNGHASELYRHHCVKRHRHIPAAYSGYQANRHAAGAGLDFRLLSGAQ